MPTTAEQLQNAYNLIRAGKNAEAEQILLPIVSSDPGNADAWWLLANALGDTPKAQYALQQVLSLRPDDDRARRALERLRSKGMVSESPFSGSVSSSPVESIPVSDTFTRNIGDLADASKRGHPIENDDPFSDMGREKRKNDQIPPVYPPYPPRRSGSHPCVMILAVIGALTLLACALCSVTLFTGAGAFTDIAQQVVGTLQVDPEFAEVFNVISTEISAQSSSAGGTRNSDQLPDTLPRSANDAQDISYGVDVSESLPDSSMHAYNFAGEAGVRVRITLTSTDSNVAFDPLLALYDPSGEKIMENDDIRSGVDLNSRIEMVLPQAGKYTILVASFSETGGDYLIELERRE